jgi:hypothetical protein
VNKLSKQLYVNSQKGRKKKKGGEGRREGGQREAEISLGGFTHKIHLF